MPQSVSPPPAHTTYTIHLMQADRPVADAQVSTLATQIAVTARRLLDEHGAADVAEVHAAGHRLFTVRAGELDA